MYLIFWNGMRLCQDNRLRTFANYGTYKECVKEYRSLPAARTKAKKIKGVVVKVPDGMYIDAAGQIIEDVEGKVTIHRPEEFAI